MPNGRTGLLSLLRQKASELTEGMVGAPGTPYGEAMNAVMAGGRSILPGGGTYDDELQNVREAREERYPGAYSVIDALRNGALWNAGGRDIAANAPGYAAPIVYHGSPHVFDRFSLQKMGSGEGAQIPELLADHGWGGYFAKKPEWGERYRQEVSANALTLDGKPVDALPEPQADALTAIAAEVGQGHPLPAALERGRAWLRSVAKTNPRAYAEAARVADEITPERLSGSGRLYEMDVPDTLMDFDRPLSEQPATIRDTLTATGVGPTVTGAQAYDALAARLGSKEAASKLLAARGIPGHTYRTHATENVVMYTDEPIRMMGSYPSLADMLRGKGQ